MNKRILCLDIGNVRIGIAVSDPSRTIASPVEVLRRVGWGPDSRHIKALCDQYETDEVLSGLPLNMDGTEGFQARSVREFCAQLEKLGLKVFYQDERLTTVTAEEILQRPEAACGQGCRGGHSPAVAGRTEMKRIERSFPWQTNVILKTKKKTI